MRTRSLVVGYFHPIFLTNSDTPQFDGLTLTTNSDCTTTIHGIVVDQSALHGLLQKVRDIGLPLISVTRVEPMPTAPPTSPV